MMKLKETIATQSGWPLHVETRTTSGRLEIIFKSAMQKPCLLHWGVRRAAQPDWELPPQISWPAGSSVAGKNALQSPFLEQDNASNLVIRFDQLADYASLDFALYFPEEKRWDNNQRRNYQISLNEAKPPAASPMEVLRAKIGGDQILFERAFQIEVHGQLAVLVTKAGEHCRISFLSDISGDLLLHWAIARRSPNEWLIPPLEMRGAQTVLWQEQTAQTPFAKADNFNSLNLQCSIADAPLGIAFVLKRANGSGQWINHRGGNFYVPIKTSAAKSDSPGLTQFRDIADEIVHAEMDHNSWTLMHRFNLCHDLLDRVGGETEGLAWLYVWLRYSAIRQLTWQRNYNTKPRELAHAQDRLTQKLAEIFRAQPDLRPIVRLMFVIVGRGGEGQRIRDEILNIMHRHHVKEMSGHFLEEWHQKLHNNTTPDDVVICEAFLEFLRSNGNTDLFYKTLEAGGVTRQRLKSFERPIRSSPQFNGHIKDGLIHDFQNFLTILKTSHSATDFETALNATRHQLGDHLRGQLDHLFWRRNDLNEPLVPFVARITEVRRELAAHFQNSSNLRELLYLDLALEQLLRGVIERNIHLKLNGDQLSELILHVLENITLSSADIELSTCLRHWQRLLGSARFSADWSLHAKAVTDRAARALATWIDRFYKLFQSKAEYLGHGFQAEPWTITLFSEEIVRGSSLGFALSMLLHHLDPILRNSAHLGAWQIVSRGRGAGKIEVADSLRSLQRARFDSPTIVIADKIMGDEEIPENVTAVIAPDVTDVVSHVAVRARNANILFASCHDTAALGKLKAQRGNFLQLEARPDGEVIISEHAPENFTAATPAKFTPRAPLPAKRIEKYAVNIDDFDEHAVGGKSCSLARLRTKLPGWIHLPASVAIPFGVFDRVLKLSANRETAARYERLIQQLSQADSEKDLAALRETVMELKAPEELQTDLRSTMSSAGLPWPDDWEKIWTRLKQVWASKWNDRAFLSRKRFGIPHENLCMAELIQQVVPADYAFVIHTVNPTNGNAEELYAEMVLGLGETLVGNFPGRALGWTCNKKTGEQTVLSYPSKSSGVFGSGLIFRSDSSGEDLAGYAGAGLYDSVLLEAPAEKQLDYSNEPLIWDQNFRRDLFAKILRLGLEIERAFGSAQDIEGAIAQGKVFVVQSRPQVGLENEK